MDEGSDLIIRPSWPLPDWGGQRVSYGTPLIMLSGAFLIFTLTRWIATGMPLTLEDLLLPFAGTLLTVTAVFATAIFDGVMITANSERVVFRRWLQTSQVIPVAQLAALQLSTLERRVQGKYSTTVSQRIVSFIDKNGQSIAALDWGQFTDEDVDRLSKATGVRQDGGWFYKESA